MIVGFTHTPAHGGPGTFQVNMERELKKLGHTIVYPSTKQTPDVVLVVGGTKRLIWLYLQKMKGARVVHRLDGMNWQQDVVFPGFKTWLKLKLNNLLVLLIWKYLADLVVYQSEFVKTWWEESKHYRPPNHMIIYNGVDLNNFTPSKESEKRDISILCVEGNIVGDHFQTALISNIVEYDVRLYGRISTSNSSQRFWTHELPENVMLLGELSRSEVPRAMSGRFVFLSLDVNPACPNAVIEAMASGLPIVAFNTGSLSEIVRDNSGILIEYGANSWELELPDTSKLELAIGECINSYDELSQNARRTCEKYFSMERMTKNYVVAIEKALKNRRSTRGIS